MERFWKVRAREIPSSLGALPGVAWRLDFVTVVLNLHAAS